MSNWTHVAGIVRVNDIRGLTQSPDFDRVFGKECLYDSPSETWEDAEKHPERYLPMGTEGSLRINVWTNPDKSQVAAYTVSIFGDLRDHDSPDAVIEWFQEKVRSLWVRAGNAVIIVENDDNGTKVWSYTGEDEEE